MRNWRPILYCLTLGLMAAACANIGNPDGGDYDQTPPKVLACSPADHAVGNDKKKVRILFDEYIKLENASEKVVVSPPQIESANVRADGKQVKIDLYDDLLPNTTYTIDFSDAIQDNNEGNPMGNYTYSFSTGDHIDTMEVSGTVLNAADLEPVKGTLVGLYPDDSTFSDTLFTTTPFTRVSRTNSVGKFTIKGVRPGRYRAFALDDKDGNFIFSQKSEAIAFSTESFTTGSKPDVRYDTIWRDTTHYDSIRVVPYTHYLPDNLVLLSFLEGGQDQHLLKTERTEPDFFKLYFTAPADSLPKIKGINFDEKCLVAESNQDNDTITYWVTDTTFTHQQDTLAFSLSYLETDTAGILQPHTDTLEIVPKTTWAKIHKEKQDQIDEWNKDRAKKMKKAKEPLPYEENPFEKTFLDISCKPGGNLDPNQNVRVTAKEPLARVDTTKLHFYIKKDTDWLPAPFLFLPVEKDLKSYMLYAEWEPAKQYRFVTDSAAFTSVLGNSTKQMKTEFKVKGEEEYGAIFIHPILADTGVVVQLLSRSDKPVAEQRLDGKGWANFYYLKPQEYFVRCYIDRNGNDQWDTGAYDSLQQAEEVFYFPKPIVLKAQWNMEQDWDVRGINRASQKPRAITKQKEDKKKTVKDRNKERREKQNRNSRSGSRSGSSSQSSY